jgi:hypothetical protein
LPSTITPLPLPLLLPLLLSRGDCTRGAATMALTTGVAITHRTVSSPPTICTRRRGGPRVALPSAPFVLVDARLVARPLRHRPSPRRRSPSPRRRRRRSPSLLLEGDLLLLEGGEGGLLLFSSKEISFSSKEI